MYAYILYKKLGIVRLIDIKNMFMQLINSN